MCLASSYLCKTKGQACSSSSVSAAFCITFPLLCLQTVLHSVLQQPQRQQHHCSPPAVRLQAALQGKGVLCLPRGEVRDCSSLDKPCHPSSAPAPGLPIFPW